MATGKKFKSTVEKLADSYYQLSKAETGQEYDMPGRTKPDRE